MPQPAVAQPAFGAAQDLTPVPAESPTGLWIVRLADAPLATYQGGVAGLSATSPTVTGAERLDTTTEVSVAYLDYLADRQAQAQDAIADSIGRSPQVEFEYLNVLNAMAVRLSAAEAGQVKRLSEVVSVQPDQLREIETDVSHDLIGSPTFWDGQTGPELATRGEGVVVGMLDTGVNAFHPSFAAADGEGYVHENPLGSGTFVGACDPAHPNHQDVCNDKLIGAWNFNTGGPSFPNVLDNNSHGSHVGSTIAGNRHEATFNVGGTEHTRTLQGVAPRANVISYLVCDPGCPQTSSVAAVNQAIADPTDVLNYSISGADNPWSDIVDLAFLDAFEAGIFVAASAGNAGPGPTIAKTGPWNASVAATTVNRIIHHDLDVVGPGTVPPELVGLEGFPTNPGHGPWFDADVEAEIRWAGQVAPANQFGCQPFAAGAFAGSLALIQRGGGCAFVPKITNAANAGAVGVVLFSDLPGPAVATSGLQAMSIPTVNLSLTQGSALRDFIVANAPTPTEALVHAGTEVLLDDGYQDIVAGFSSRGPSQFNLSGPTFGAPGVNVLAAAMAQGGEPVQYMFNQGTSMASPHGAGSAALLVGLHPDWSPAQVRSALAGTADPDVLAVDDAGTPATTFDQGSGRVDLAAAATVGLVMDESHANMVAANPAIGGDPRTLNVPHLVDRTCGTECSWTRTVTSVADTTASYTVQVDAPAEVTVTVSPAEFTIAPGDSQQLEITLTAGPGAPAGDWVFASVALVTSDQHAGGAPISPVQYPITAITQPGAGEGTPVIDVSPGALAQELPVDGTGEQTLTIGNSGDADLDWAIHEATPAASAGFTAATGPDRAPAGTVSPGSTRDYQNLPAAEAILDGGFEAGEPNPFWDESSSTFGTVLCTVAFCGTGTGTGPHGGTWWAWFGGINAFEVGFARQQVTLQPGTAELRFWLEIPVGSGTGQDFLTVSLGGTEVFSVTDADAASFATYSEVVVDVSEFADGGTYELSFDSTVFGGGASSTNFFVDDVSLDNQAPTGPCASPADVPWLSVSPMSGSTVPGGASEVSVGFDAAGLALGEHEALLCVTSNDPASPLVEVPVSLTVVEDTGPPPGDPTCDVTIVGVHEGPLTVSEGVTCLAAGSRVLGEVNVLQGAGLVATAAVVQGPVSAVGATVVEVAFSQVTGPVLVSGATHTVSLFANQVTGSVNVVGAGTGDTAVTVSGNTVIGSLACFGNDPAPTDHGLSNTATAGKIGQCAEL